MFSRFVSPRLLTISLQTCTVISRCWASHLIPDYAQVFVASCNAKTNEFDRCVCLFWLFCCSGPPQRTVQREWKRCASSIPGWTRNGRSGGGYVIYGVVSPSNSNGGKDSCLCHTDRTEECPSSVGKEEVARFPNKKQVGTRCVVLGIEL
jgi:hypothetical protein